MQDAATILPDSTRNAGTLLPDDDDAVSLDAGFGSIVPTSSNFFPTCGVSADAFAMRRYVWGALEADGAAAPAVVVAPAASADDFTASASTYFGASVAAGTGGGVAPAVPAVPVVEAVPVVPTAVLAAELPGASFRHPVTVIFSVLAALLCCGVVCV